MKRILTFSIVAVLATVVLASCSKRDHWRDDNNTNDEYAYVTGYNKGYPYSIVQFSNDNTYAIIESRYNDELPENGDELYGDFYRSNQYRIVRNNSRAPNKISIRVIEDGIQTATDATDALDYYCFGSNASSATKQNKVFISSKQNTPRKLDVQITK
ncbi:hypothetical protein [Niabella beijingensis]|uniref:hypothetical protein n=1 Tax=Niabella beijingensis TaxID=2872700 RepID=UPI001CBE656D|nr:hypothetical protein [Niabella beijingensis]MBZ4191144.1 hypothetical protein [Niabella beijingensis]